MNTATERAPSCGLLAEFADHKALVAAARGAYAAGYRRLDAFSPFPVEGLSEAIGFHRDALAPVVLGGGVLGAGVGYAMQYYLSAVHYPLNVGGRPLHSWPAFVPVIYEMTILFAALAAVFGMLLLNGLPRPYHPVFNVPAFARASRDRFFLYIESSDPLFDLQDTRRFLRRQGALDVADVPA